MSKEGSIPKAIPSPRSLTFTETERVKDARGIHTSKSRRVDLYLGSSASMYI